MTGTYGTFVTQDTSTVFNNDLACTWRIPHRTSETQDSSVGFFASPIDILGSEVSLRVYDYDIDNVDDYWLAWDVVGQSYAMFYVSFTSCRSIEVTFDVPAGYERICNRPGICDHGFKGHYCKITLITRY